ncbi:MFS transporter [Vibrio ruber]|uniref:Inner membrane transport protein YnfM n=1 Tax=Vibrio ruber (strain DSM 16370 / JCM 11486 / BCRC 17186 / CECT 7878 / LMG 23124 / VR1) TaxID=1123498 RepID=A0A1R4LA36_VIBR1|nr:MFS transporter [Vibrio ruber]WNJ94994.1 MFS transporter [Vibrio ruber]SJN53470.1 Inner membrane transport protein YnfM [Vibrio ruber DSM 16370]
MIERDTPQYRQVSFGLALGAFIVFCNLYLFQPILPHMAEVYQLSETKVNWLFAASTLALSVTLVPWAICSEAFGRRKIMMIGLLTLPLLGFILLLHPTWWILVTARALTGVAIAAFASVAVAYMVEEFSPQAFQAAIGGYIAANSLGGICGRILGGNLTDLFNWETAVAVVSVLSIAGVLYVYFRLPPQQHFTPRKGQFLQHQRSVLMHLRQRKLWLAMLFGGANFALFVNLYTVMGFRLVSAPYSIPVGFASLIFICYLGGTLSSRLASRWLRHHNTVTGLIAGTCLSLSGMWLAMIESLPMIIIALICISSGAFFSHTLAYAWVSQHAKQAKATATALYLVHYYLGGSLGGFFLIACWQYGGWHTVVAGGTVIYLFLLTLCWRLKEFDTYQAQQHTNSI